MFQVLFKSNDLQPSPPVTTFAVAEFPNQHCMIPLAELAGTIINVLQQTSHFDSWKVFLEMKTFLMSFN